MRHARAIGALLVLAAPLFAGCAPGMAPSASVTTAVQGWEYYFRLDWQPVDQPKGREIAGYIYNKYGAAASVQILAQGLDSSGEVLGQQVSWVQGTVPPLERAYFTVPGLPNAPKYRVTVWAFEFVQAPGVPQR